MLVAGPFLQLIQCTCAYAYNYSFLCTFWHPMHMFIVITPLVAAAVDVSPVSLWYVHAVNLFHGTKYLPEQPQKWPPPSLLWAYWRFRTALIATPFIDPVNISPCFQIYVVNQNQKMMQSPFVLASNRPCCSEWNGTPASASISDLRTWQQSRRNRFSLEKIMKLSTLNSRLRTLTNLYNGHS